MIKSIYTGVCALTLLGLTACSTISYEEPETGNRARVRFAVDDGSDGTFMGGGGNMTIRSYETQSCEGEDEWMSLRNGPLVNSSPRTLDMPLFRYHKNAAKEFYVATDEPLRLMFSMEETDGQYSYFCAVFVETTISPGQDYEFVFNGKSKRRCTVDLNKIIDGKSGPETQTIKTFNNKVAPNNEGCIKAFKKTRWY